MFNNQDTIIALSTPMGEGALGVIRISGTQALSLVSSVFKGADLTKVPANSIHYGYIKDGETNIDEVMVSIFHEPKSFTAEDVVEISCHGSQYILETVQQLLISKGARLAERGEFTFRAFMNGRIDLSQAEAVADLISAQNKASHDIALKQIRGGFSNEIKYLRDKLIEFAALIELELDFSEEDVEFADRTQLVDLVNTIQTVVKKLADSFQYGNAIKKGVPVAIVGKPNVGKSTLLNALLNEDRAIVSDIAGTTRDVIEDSITIEGITFRFIDTAGLRETDDTIESIGISKTKEQLEKAQIVIYMDEISEDHEGIVERFKALDIKPDQKAIILLNKADAFHSCHQYDVEEAVSTLTSHTKTLAFSAKEQTRIDELKQTLTTFFQNQDLQDQTVVTNLRHYEALTKAYEALNDVLNALQSGVSGDLLALDIRRALNALGEVTGEVDVDRDILGAIFSKFCIGK